jgi:hypothetical protein
MKKLALIALAAGMVVSGTGIASAQYYDPGYREYPRYRDYDGPPRPYYRERYRERGDYEEPRSYGREGYYRPGPYRTWNGCQQGWTVQDGLCKPYRGY